MQLAQRERHTEALGLPRSSAIEEGRAGPPSVIWLAHGKQGLVAIDLPAMLALGQLGVCPSGLQLQERAAAPIMHEEVQPSLQPDLWGQQEGLGAHFKRRIPQGIAFVGIPGSESGEVWLRFRCDDIGGELAQRQVRRMVAHGAVEGAARVQLPTLEQVSERAVDNSA